ncbi:cytochrome P450 [Mycena belliarum]|uniref:Cytochrome P450 n=1 Tax=Mycena belliarum TaxID=1033014 RepID=A0AAD6XEF8_9AGAR|nr:cytochrome P450 [Mycena belliae]KAJ7075524.1 cytochrome P450 [Mycena belliae]
MASLTDSIISGSSPIKLLAYGLGSLGAYALYSLLKIVYHELRSTLRHLPGPKSTHFFYGNLLDIYKADNSVLHEKWVHEHGPTLQYKVLFGMKRLYTTDIKALNHFLTNSNIYQKPAASRLSIGRVVGPGIIVAEGEEHRHQRKIMNPAFGAPQVRELTSIFVDKSLELRDIWAAQASNAGGTANIDVLAWLTKATLDIIGLAGFNYPFNALSGGEGASELGAAFSTIFESGTTMSPLRFLQQWFPALGLIPTARDRLERGAQSTMKRIGRELLAESKREIAADAEGKRARDLLSLLVRANTAKDLPASQRLSDEDVVAQVPTFLVAGHETTSSATTWALFSLTQHPAVQARLRAELLAVDTDTPTMDVLNALPYLDCVVRETLRIHAPVGSTVRQATQDDVVPLATPFTDVYGKVHETLNVSKGQTFIIPILAMNRDPVIWGPDAMEFVPERWEAQPPINNALPGIWGHMLSFLGGPRACIGYRFSLVEMKALLFTLVRAFEFELAVPAAEIGKRSVIVQRPILRSAPEAGNQMPLLVRRYVRA